VKKVKKAKGEHEALYTEETMPSVSPTVHCVIILAVQYFIIYTSLAILRTVTQYSKSIRVKKAKEAVEQMCSSITYAPALSVLFLATRMRAIQLTKGETEKFQLPQPWVQYMMYACTCALPVQAIIVLVTALYTPPQKDGEGTKAKEDDTEPQPVVPDPPSVQMNSSLKVVLAVLHYACMVVLYCGCIAVCVGSVVMTAPKQLWLGKQPPVSTALSCTLALTCMFFLVYFAWVCVWMVNRRKGKVDSDKLQKVMEAGKDAVNLAPMLAILFVIARMRAMQVDPLQGNPQPWAQRNMAVATVAMGIQVLAAILLPLFDKGGEIKALKVTEVAVRQLAVLTVFCCALSVMLAVFIMHAPKGYKHTPPVSTAMHCVITLTNLYFFVYFVVYVTKAVQEFIKMAKKNTDAINNLMSVVDAGRKTMMHAPMLAMLFVAARMRALQLTMTVVFDIPSTAGPQEWVQHAMVVATWSVIIQTIATYIANVMDTISKKKDKKSPVEIVFDVINYICLLGMYGGAVIVIVGIFAMTPEALPPYSAY